MNCCQPKFIGNNFTIHCIGGKRAKKLVMISTEFVANTKWLIRDVCHRGSVGWGSCVTVTVSELRGLTSTLNIFLLNMGHLSGALKVRTMAKNLRPRISLKSTSYARNEHIKFLAQKKSRALCFCQSYPFKKSSCIWNLFKLSFTVEKEDSLSEIWEIIPQFLKLNVNW